MAFLLTDSTIESLKKVVESTMDFTCDVLRATAGSADTYGQDTENTFNTFLTGLICSFGLTGTEKETPQADFTQYQPVLRVPVGTDILLTDRVANITDRHGQVVQPSVFEIVAITPRKGSILVALEAVV